MIVVNYLWLGGFQVACHKMVQSYMWQQKGTFESACHRV